MVLQPIQPHLHDIVYKMASIARPIPLKGGVESLGDIGPTIGDNSREVQIELEQTALLHSKHSNDGVYTITQQLGNVLRRGEIRSMTETCREYTHLDGQLLHSAQYMIPAPDAATPNQGPWEYPQFQSKGL